MHTVRYREKSISTSRTVTGASAWFSSLIAGINNDIGLNQWRSTILVCGGSGENHWRWKRRISLVILVNAQQIDLKLKNITETDINILQRLPYKQIIHTDTTTQSSIST